MLFVESSVVARAYLADEDGHAEAHALVFGGDPILASELIRVEVTRALVSAVRDRRISQRVGHDLLALIDADLAGTGTASMIELDGPPTLARARDRARARSQDTRRHPSRRRRSRGPRPRRAR